ncbi:MFS transporter [Myceligenerans sp. I2]|uniref:MFS transporter n=1 Tax=Myceligenerans indicum TaxID=2593663 RepID=A0ABS1LJI1_9MICO|nr:MFS transporter [Myceligenerans indicum]
MVAVLAVTQTVGYGVLTYALPVLLVPMAADLGTTPAVVAGAVAVSVLASGLVAIPVGRWLDRRGGRALMTAGSVLGVVVVAAWSQVTQVWQLYVVLGLTGVALAASTYEAAFAVLISRTAPAHRDRALLAVTVVAGFASSVFLPLTGLLSENFGWRTALLCLAGLLALTAVPGHALAVPTGAGQPGRSLRRGLPPAVSEPGFWLATAAFVAHAAAVSAMGLLLVSHLTGAGWAVTTASATAGLLGMLSVTGRLLLTGLSRRWGMATVTAVVFAVQGLGAVLLPHAASLAGAVACVVAFGVGFGVATIARPAILADRYGTAGFATTAAVMVVPLTVARAGAPLGAAALGDPGFLPVVGVSCFVAAGLLGALRFVRHPALSGSTPVAEQGGPARGG